MRVSVLKCSGLEAEQTTLNKLWFVLSSVGYTYTYTYIFQM